VAPTAIVAKIKPAGFQERRGPETFRRPGSLRRQSSERGRREEGHGGGRTRPHPCRARGSPRAHPTRAALPVILRHQLSFVAAPGVTFHWRSLMNSLMFATRPIRFFHSV